MSMTRRAALVMAGALAALSLTGAGRAFAQDAPGSAAGPGGAFSAEAAITTLSEALNGTADTASTAGAASGVWHVPGSQMARQAAARGTGNAHSPVVVELYTSQGCSACPPADKLMEQLAGRDDVLPLALHVDYWDYLGWKDDFADPGFTARQKAYASAHGKRMIYTPQMVVDGTTFVKGARPMALAENIARAMTLPQHYSLSVRKLDNGHYEVQAQALGQDRPKGGLVLELVHYMPRQQVKILRGENAGTELQYVNVVTYWKTLTDWDGTQPLKIEVTPQKDMPGAVLLQRDGMGAIEAAARLR